MTLVYSVHQPLLRVKGEHTLLIPPHQQHGRQVRAEHFQPGHVHEGRDDGLFGDGEGEHDQLGIDRVFVKKLTCEEDE